jgi:Dyp-type peroxidase family
MTEIELGDIQGLVARGYSDLNSATYVLLRVDAAEAGRAWLETLLDQVTPAPANPQDIALNVAFTASGLSALGLPDVVLAQFSNEFTAGMTTSHRRRMFGDVDASAPETWSWGGPDTPEPHILLALFGRDADTLNQRHAELSAAFRGVSELTRLDAFTDLDGKEHFGFADGISQPTIEGISSRKDVPPNTIRIGEFVLGYVNEYGLYTDRPLVDRGADPGGVLAADIEGSGRADLGRNGTYLVFRQLAQDVRGFWRYLASLSEDRNQQTWLAARMVGRWPSGAPVTLSPDVDNAQLSGANDFTYQYADPLGLQCPIGAHVRRAHPRDSLDPAPGTARSVELDKRHRLLRRGREYGPPVPPESLYSVPPLDDPERGLFFICVAANIGRQFEFVQHSWVNNPKFDDLYDEPDPVVGYHPSQASNFTIPSDPVRLRLRNLPQFVTTRGGAYFFLPSLRALRYLSTLEGGVQPGNVSLPSGS